MKRVKRHLIFKTRVNAAGTEFFSVKAMSLDGMREYFSAAQDAKTFRGAIAKINKGYEYRYAHCYRGYEYIQDFGEVKFDGPLDVQKTSKDELIAAIREMNLNGIADMVEAQI